MAKNLKLRIVRMRVRHGAFVYVSINPFGEQLFFEKGPWYSMPTSLN